jgi:hypothetical protein
MMEEFKVFLTNIKKDIFKKGYFYEEFDICSKKGSTPTTLPVDNAGVAHVRTALARCT